MLAAVMSSCDAFMVASSALFTENIYKPFIAPNREDKHYIKVGRITSGFVVLCGIFFAYELESVVHGLEVFWKISAMMGVPFLLGIIWRRATPAAAWAGTLVSFAAWLFTGTISFFGKVLWDFNITLVNKLPEFMVFNGKIYLPWQMIIYLSLGFVTVVLVSLFTKPVDKEKLDKLYACMRTPIGPDEPETEPFTLPEGVEPAPNRPWIKHPDFELQKPTTVTIVGFLAGWGAVALLLASFFWILS
jgi:Na+/proline symporter